ncbi:MAG TPA: TolC family protein [Polyangiales bacterium]
MNVKSSNVRSAGLTALSLLLATSAGAQAPAARPDVAPKRPAPSAAAPAAAPAAPPVATAAGPSEGEPLSKFDLAEVLMAPSGGLTADQAGKKARARAPQIFAAKASADAARTEVDGSWTSFIPIIDLAFQYKRVKNVPNRNVFGEPDPNAPTPDQVRDLIGQITDPAAQTVIGGLYEGLAAFNDPSQAATFQQPLNQYALTLGVNYVVSDVFLRAWPAYKAAVSRSDSQKIQVEVASSMVDLTARNAFYAYARALAQRAVDEQAFRQAEAQAAQIKLFVDAGTSAQVDYMTAAARVEETRTALAVSEGRVAINQNSLAVLLGMKAEEISGIAEPVLEQPPQPGSSADEFVHTAFERRAELRALRKVVETNEHLKSVERGGAMPTLSVFANDFYGQPNPRYIPPNRDKFRNSWEVGASVAWRPNNSLNGVYNLRRSDAQIARARADLAAQEDAIRTEVFSAYRTYISAVAANAASQARLAAAEEAYRVRLATYKVGAGVIVDLQLADLTVSQARLAMANSAIATREALAALNRAAGLDLQQQ